MAHVPRGATRWPTCRSCHPPTPTLRSNSNKEEGEEGEEEGRGGDEAIDLR
jgi:hypothetical protein